jgi:hypothetical protein
MQQFNQQPPSNQFLSQLTMLKQMLGNDPSSFMQSLMQTNPAFAKFVADNQNKTPEQAFRENGLDFSQIKQLLK